MSAASCQLPATSRRDTVKNKKLLISLVILGAIVLITGLNIYRSRQGTEIPVQVFRVKEEKIEENVMAGGKVEVVKKEEITARTNAMVEEVLVEEGDRVEAGQVLVRLDTADLVQALKREEANLALRKAELAKSRAAARPQEVEQDRAALKRAEVVFANAKINYQRNQTLYQEGAASREDLEAAYQQYVTAESDYRSAQQKLSLRLEGETKETVKALEAQVKQAEVAVSEARERLARAQVKASIDGVVLSLGAEKGKYVTTGTSLAVVGDTEGLQVKADISESDSGRLAVGQQVKITSSAVPDEEFDGQVVKVGAAAVTKTKSGGEQTDVQVTVSITKFSSRLKPGFTVDLNITTARKNKALIIPYEAVTEKNKNKEVFLVEKGKARRRRIQTGMGNELYLTVEKGLQKGDKVVVNPPDKLKDGSSVKETPYEAGKPSEAGKGE